MAKRKRGQEEDGHNAPGGKARKQDNAQSSSPSPASSVSIQIVTGSYERVLHGIVATIPHAILHEAPDAVDKESTPVSFSDAFLFNAHSSAIRCLAISPPSDSNKVFLATGSTDERINIYSLSTAPPPSRAAAKLSAHQPSPSIIKATSTNPANKELGSLNHHSSTITTLTFPTRTKLLSTAADNSIAILRTRDWSVLSSLRAPVPKPAGRPSGDTAAPGEVPAGVNDVAVHPSLKLMVTVGRGERCMRLWNLVTGKKAGVLQFDKTLLAQLSEARYSGGEARKVVWEPRDGEEFVVGFERGAVVFGTDSKPRASVLPQPLTKFHQIRYLPGLEENILAVSTEDGRLLFYKTALPSSTEPIDNEDKEKDAIPTCELVAQLGGRDLGVGTRIKDFDLLPATSVGEGDGRKGFIVITACSDGVVQIWTLDAKELEPHAEEEVSNGTATAEESAKTKTKTVIRSVGSRIGSYDTANRITCMKAFIMTGKHEAAVNGDVAKELESQTSSDSGESEE